MITVGIWDIPPSIRYGMRSIWGLYLSFCRLDAILKYLSDLKRPKGWHRATQ